MIKTIDGKLFKRLIISGANNLINQKNKIDALNVFPVPDGDTGTNMSSTIKAGVEGIANVESANLGEVAAILSKKMLFGARGNSGVILSQIFKGLALGFENLEQANVLDLLKAFKSATERAYASVLKAIEGTILTVIRQTTEELEKVVNEKTSIEEFFELVVKFSRIACNNTPNLLKILREVGVNDSGGEGLQTIFVGINEAIKGQDIVIDESEATEKNSFISDNEIYEGEFGYCTEFIIELNNVEEFDKNEFEKSLARRAKSLVVVQDNEIVKVHGHTAKPGNLLNFGQKYGEFIKIKSENMSLQADEARNKNVIVNSNNESDSLCGIVSCNLGSGIIERMKEYGCDVIIESGQTQNPSAQDIIDAINSVNAKNVFVLPNNSNIIMAAKQAAQAITDKKVHIIPTKSQMQGLTAMLNFSKDNSAKDNTSIMKSAIKNVTSGEVTQSIRTTTIDGIKIKEGQFIAIADSKMISSEDDYISVAKTLIKKQIKKHHEIITIYYGNDVSESDAYELQNFIQAHYSTDVEIVNGNQPHYHFLISFE